MTATPAPAPEPGSDAWVLDLIGASAPTTPGVWKPWGMRLYADQAGTSDLEAAVLIADTHQRVDGRPRTHDLEWFRLTQPMFLLPLLDELLELRADVRNREHMQT